MYRSLGLSLPSLPGGASVDPSSIAKSLVGYVVPPLVDAVKGQMPGLVASLAQQLPALLKDVEPTIQAEVKKLTPMVQAQMALLMPQLEARARTFIASVDSMAEVKKLKRDAILVLLAQTAIIVGGVWFVTRVAR